MTACGDYFGKSPANQEKGIKQIGIIPKM